VKGYFSRPKRTQKPFLDRGSLGCGIISDNINMDVGCFEMIAMNERLLEAYRRFLDFRAAISMQVMQDRIAPYDWYKLPDKLSGFWMPYGMMLDEHCRQIANSINELLRYIDSLEAWGDVIKDKNEDNEWEIIVEFIIPLATLTINMPYIVRSRFIYSVVHLCHQCNLTKDTKWVDKLPEEDKIWFNAADEYCSRWQRYTKLKVALEKIANTQFDEDTKDFRNKYNHRYSLGIEFGMAEFIKRIVVDGMVSYALGDTAPLKIDQLLPVLKKQHANCLKAFEEYQNLVNEQISAIGKE
jgi:hypothetical protein